jgi:hypothetical protein
MHSDNKSRNFTINGRSFREIYRLFMSFFSHLAFEAVIFESRIHLAAEWASDFTIVALTQQNTTLPFLSTTSIKKNKTKKQPRTKNNARIIVRARKARRWTNCR